MERKKLIKLVTAAKNNNHKAVDTLFNAYYNDVYYFALKTVKDEETACEVTQDTFVSILKNFKNLKEPAAFVTWMKQIAYNHCARFFQKRKDVLVEEDEDGNTVFDTVMEERAAFVPDEALDQEDFRKTIMVMLDELSPEQRSATMLYYYSEMSVKQIAQIQGVSEGTVKSRLNYARKAVKKSVEDYEKKNDVRLHSVALLPLLFWLFAGAEEKMPTAAIPTMVGEITAATGTVLTIGSETAGAGLLAKLAGVPVAIKVISGFVVTSLVVGSVGVALLKDENSTEPTFSLQTSPSSPSMVVTEPSITEDEPTTPDNGMNDTYEQDEDSPFIRYMQHLMTVSTDNGIEVFANDTPLQNTADGAYAAYEQSSLDGTVMAFTTDRNTLYVTDGKKLTKVDDNVYQYNFELSVSGSGLVYVTTEDDETQRLHYYNVGSGKQIELDKGANHYDTAIAPNGQTLAYIAIEDSTFSLVFFDGEHSHKLASTETSLFGMSNDGTYIYTANGYDVYCYDSEGNRQKVGTLDEDTDIKFNAEYTQLMFNCDGKTYISDKGQECDKVSNDNLYLIVPPNSNACTHYNFTTYPVKDLYDHVYLSDDSEVWLIRRNSGESAKLVSKVSDVKLDASAEYLYYIYDSEELRCAKISDGDRASQTCKVIVDDYVFDYVVTSDGSLVYYIENETLYCVNGKTGGKPTEISEGVDYPYYLAIGDKDLVCFIANRRAYVCAGQKLPAEIFENAVYLKDTPNGFIYIKTDDGFYSLPDHEEIIENLTEYVAYQQLAEMRDSTN